MNQHQKVIIAAALALLFHTVGLVGMIFFDRSLFVQLTPLNMLVSLALLVWTQEGKDGSFWLFLGVCFVTGMLTEYSGVNYQLLFGEYVYGAPLGPQVGNVPLIIGVNWFIMMMCCGVTVQFLLNAVWNKVKDEDQPMRTDVGFWAIVLDGALLATAFDWLMEPVAVKLGFWTWLGDGAIPFKNYWSWFLVSALLLLLFRKLPFPKHNQFAIHLLLIQTLFFLILRTYL